MIQWVDAIKRGLAKLVPNHIVQTLTHQGVDANWISVVTNHVLETGPAFRGLVQEVEIMARCLATIPSLSIQSTTAGNPPSSHILSRDVLELFDHFKKMQTELVQQSANLAFLFDSYHTVSELHDQTKL